MYFSSPFKYRDNYSVDSYKVKVIEYEYVEINNISCICFQDGGQDGRQKLESDVSQLCVQVYKDECSVQQNTQSTFCKWGF